MSLESDIYKAGPGDPQLFASRKRKHQILEQEMTSAFQQEQLLKKEKIGDAATVVLDQAESRANDNDPLGKKELADLCISALSQINFERPGENSGRMKDREIGDQGSTFSLPEYDYYMTLIQTATEGVPIKATGSRVTLDGVKPMSAERFRNIFETALKKLRNVMGGDPELKEVLPNFFKEQQNGLPVPLSVPKFKNFFSLSEFLDKHS